MIANTIGSTLLAAGLTGIVMLRPAGETTTPVVEGATIVQQDSDDNIEKLLREIEAMLAESRTKHVETVDAVEVTAEPVQPRRVRVQAAPRAEVRIARDKAKVADAMKIAQDAIAELDIDLGDVDLSELSNIGIEIMAELDIAPDEMHKLLDGELGNMSIELKKVMPLVQAHLDDVDMGQLHEYLGHIDMGQLHEHLASVDLRAMQGHLEKIDLGALHGHLQELKDLDLGELHGHLQELKHLELGDLHEHLQELKHLEMGDLHEHLQELKHLDMSDLHEHLLELKIHEPMDQDAGAHIELKVEPHVQHLLKLHGADEGEGRRLKLRPGITQDMTIDVHPEIAQGQRRLRLKSSDAGESVPLLSDLPLVGELFIANDAEHEGIMHEVMRIEDELQSIGKQAQDGHATADQRRRVMELRRRADELAAMAEKLRRHLHEQGRTDEADTGYIIQTAPGLFRFDPEMDSIIGDVAARDNDRVLRGMISRDDAERDDLWVELATEQEKVAKALLDQAKKRNVADAQRAEFEAELRHAKQKAEQAYAKAKQDSDRAGGDAKATYEKALAEARREVERAHVEARRAAEQAQREVARVRERAEQDMIRQRRLVEEEVARVTERDRRGAERVQQQADRQAERADRQAARRTADAPADARMQRAMERVDRAVAELREQGRHEEAEAVRRRVGEMGIVEDAAAADRYRDAMSEYQGTLRRRTGGDQGDVQAQINALREEVAVLRDSVARLQRTLEEMASQRRRPGVTGGGGGGGAMRSRVGAAPGGGRIGGVIDPTLPRDRASGLSGGGVGRRLPSGVPDARVAPPSTGGGGVGRSVPRPAVDPAPGTGRRLPTRVSPPGAGGRTGGPAAAPGASAAPTPERLPTGPAAGPAPTGAGPNGAPRALPPATGPGAGASPPPAPPTPKAPPARGGSTISGVR